MERRKFIRQAGTAGILSAIGATGYGKVPKKDKSGFITEKEREVPVAGEFDVVVCGGGPAGIAAAIEASRLGARTALIENNGCLGGVWTSGLLTWILDYDHQPGILREITDELTRRGARSPVETVRNSYAFDHEAMKLLLDDLCRDAGTVVRFHSRICQSVVEKGRLTHVITESKSGREAWKASIFVDATGDGDVAALAGCGFDFGDSGNNHTTQPFSLLGIITGVEFNEIRDFVLRADVPHITSKKNLLAEIQKGGVESTYRQPSIHPISHNLFKIMCNHLYGYSSVNAGDVTKATMQGRQELWSVINALKRNGGVWKNIRLVCSAEQIGTREGRRIHGYYTVSADDLRDGIFHPDAIAEVRFGVDVHSVDKQSDSAEISYNRGIRSKPYTIPLRALIARDVNGLLLAGRCISGDFIAHSSYRVTGPVTTIGQAAGRAAAISVQKRKLPQELEFQEFGFDIRFG